MTNEKALILGVALGVTGSLITDIPSAAIIHEERPDKRPILYACYILFAFAVIVTVLEVSK